MVRYFFYMFLNSKLDKIIKLEKKLKENKREQDALPKDSTSRRSWLMQEENRLGFKLAEVSTDIGGGLSYDQRQELVKARKKKLGL